MTPTIPTREHKRKKTIVFDPSQQLKNERGEIISKKKRVAAYARVSTEQDAQQNSYEAQINYYTTYIQRQSKWEFVKVYADEGISGTSYRNRGGFNEMVADAKEGKIDLILTKSISRFARNTVDSLVITRELKKFGVEVFFEKENISSMDAHAELVFTIMSSIAQEESRSISENVRWGIQRSMEAGRVPLPWKSFLGFEKGPDGLPQVFEEEAKIVRKIYRDYLNGASLKQISRRLIAMGAKPPHGGSQWSRETIRNILTNEKYKGDARLQKTYTVDFLSKEVRKNRGERKQWYIHDSHDAIITAEAFRQVARNLKQRGAFIGRYYTNTPFTGKLVCGKCGASVGLRHWDLTRENVLDKWMCRDCYRNNPTGDVLMLKNSQIKKTFLTALKRVADEYDWEPSEYVQEILPTIDCNKDSILCSLQSTDPTIQTFDCHAWYNLLDSATIMPDGTIIYKFWNGKKEAVSLKPVK